jgi:hypothetical protein
VPHAAYKQGDFSGPGTLPIYDPATTRLLSGKNVRDLFPGNIIPVSRFDPVGSKVAAWYPSPTLSGLTRNFYFSR